MKCRLLMTGITLVGLFILLSLTASDESCFHGKITEFWAQDSPYDDGSGVLLSWTPLSDRERVIEYRIYRGVSEDTLFHIRTIEVDPKASVSGDRLYYYDKDYQIFVDMETAPSRLLRERGVTSDSPLFRQMPRDLSIIERYLPHFTTLGMFKNSAFFNRSRQFTDADGVTNAGLPLREFASLLANPLSGNKYYYTVLAVNERGRLMPYADIQSAIPMDDRPDTTTVLTTAYVPEEQKVYFEWLPTIARPDISLWSAWLMPRSSLPLYYQQQALNRESPFEGNFADWQRSSVKLFQIENKDAPVQYHYLDLSDRGIELPSNLRDWVTVFGCMDYSGLWAFNIGKDIRIATKEEMPVLPAFSAANKRNNKGDTLVLSFGKPIAYVTKVNFENRSRRRLLVNYEISNNKEYRINKIYFRFETPDGKLIAETTEHYLDRIISVRLPAEHAGISEFNVKTGLLYAGHRQKTDLYGTQTVRFDVENKIFLPGDVHSFGENLSQVTYDLGARSKLSADYVHGKRTQAISRSYDDIIPYPNDIYKLILRVDPEKGLVLFDHMFTVALDDNSGIPFRASLFREWFEADLTKQKNDLADFREQFNAAPNPAAADSLEQLITIKQGQLDAVVNHPVYAEVKNQTNSRRWLRTLQRYAQNNSRTMSYKLIVSDGNGLYVESEPLTDEKGEIKWIMPLPDWFDSTKTITLIGTILFTLLVVVAVIQSRRGGDLYIRPIAGLHEIDNAVGRATEMGRPIMFVPGWGTLGDVCTIASLMILNQVARKSAEYDTRIISPNCDYMVMPLAQEIVKSAYSEAGRSDAFNQNDIFFISYDQFPFAAGVNGITIRERVATVFYMGFFNAEALLMTETGNACGAIQIAGTDAITQIPFFITTCDYTLMGEEFYAASAYMSQDADLISALKAQDYLKVFIILGMIIGAALSTLNYTGFINAFPIE